MNKTQLACTIAGMLALGGLTGCKTNSHSNELSEGRATDDKNINERVKDELENDPVYKFADVRVSTFSGVVQLSGFVNTDTEKEKAQQAAQRVPGIMKVENAITIKPTPPPMPTGRTNQDNKTYSQ
jgi:hyperosmotically inducible protein